VAAGRKRTPLVSLLDGMTDRSPPATPATSSAASKASAGAAARCRAAKAGGRGCPGWQQNQSAHVAFAVPRYDISDPANPRHVGRVWVGGSIRAGSGVTVTGGEFKDNQPVIPTVKGVVPEGGPSAPPACLSVCLPPCLPL
jgi:56kDa selenium binding protein (SBP56)